MSKNTENHSTVQSRDMQGVVKDAPSGHWVYRVLPRSIWPYAQLARWDRPIGWQLLMWPCFWSVMMAINATQNPVYYNSSTYLWLVYALVLFWLGAFVMRGAGCTWNDLVDQKIDDLVDRTRSRPLPSGQVSRLQAKIFMVAQALVGFVILLQFNWFTIVLGIASLVIVFIYPFMKRFTDWPQLFLGFAFNWGALVGWAAFYGTLSVSAFYLYVGAIMWTIGYDTIYAHQDKEDDAIVGVRSTARLFDRNTKPVLFVLYGAFVLCALFAYIMADIGAIAYLGLVAGSVHMMVQIIVLDIDDNEQCLRLFRSNNITGLLIFAGLVFNFIFMVFSVD